MKLRCICNSSILPSLGQNAAVSLGHSINPCTNLSVYRAFLPHDIRAFLQKDITSIYVQLFYWLDAYFSYWQPWTRASVGVNCHRCPAWGSEPWCTLFWTRCKTSCLKLLSLLCEGKGARPNVLARFQLGHCCKCTIKFSPELLCCMAVL